MINRQGGENKREKRNQRIKGGKIHMSMSARAYFNHVVHRENVKIYLSSSTVRSQVKNIKREKKITGENGNVKTSTA